MIHITTDNAVQVVPPKNGEDYSLEELQGFVGGYIEIVRLAEDSSWLSTKRASF